VHLEIVIKYSPYIWVPNHIWDSMETRAQIKLALQATTHPLSTQFPQTRSNLKAYIEKTYKEKREKWNATQPNK